MCGSVAIVTKAISAIVVITLTVVVAPTHVQVLQLEPDNPRVLYKQVQPAVWKLRVYNDVQKFGTGIRVVASSHIHSVWQLLLFYWYTTFIHYSQDHPAG